MLPSPQVAVPTSAGSISAEDLKALPKLPDDANRLPESDGSQCENWGIGRYEATRTRQTVEASDGTFIVVTGIPAEKCPVCGDTLFPEWTRHPLIWIRRLTESDQEAVVQSYPEAVERFQKLADGIRAK
jgi:hypothetical protein